MRRTVFDETSLHDCFSPLKRIRLFVRCDAHLMPSLPEMLEHEREFFDDEADRLREDSQDK